MEKFIFVSDFDGTLTSKDFYKILIDKYLPILGQELYAQWKDKKIKDVEFLGKIFIDANRTEQEFLNDIQTIDLDPYFEDFVSEVKNSGGEFLILSAGTSYYIERLFELRNIRGIDIISNKGIYKDKGIHLLVDASSEYYSDIYGVDKSKVIKKLKTQYEKVYFAGDSGPDFEAAKNADIVFSRGTLTDMLKEQNIKSIPFNNFKEISEYLKEMEVLV